MSSDAKAVIAPDSKHPATHPRLKLFLSADIIGSTAYKQPLDMRKAYIDSELQWEWIIQGFYKEFQTRFQHHWDVMAIAEKAGVASVSKGPRPVFWKTIGDEVVFWKELTGDLQIWLTLSCWLKTISDVRNWFGKQLYGKDSQLDIKATAWVAGFPIRNKAVVSPIPIDSTKRGDLAKSAITYLDRYYRDVVRDSDAQSTEIAAAIDSSRALADVDFIGPGIDVGFRLTGFSSSKKMSISLDCAYLLAISVHRVREFQDWYKDNSGQDWAFFPSGCGFPKQGDGVQKFDQRLTVFFSGDEPLKGVLGGIRYPKFWISNVRHDSLDAKRDAFYNQNRPVLDWEALKAFCEQFYADRAKFISKPFINNEQSVALNNLTDDYRIWHGYYLLNAVPPASDESP